MAERTEIAWCDSTFNPWIGCTKVSVAEHGGGGCDHCYAERDTPVRVLRGKGRETWGVGALRNRTSAAYWRQPVKWNAAKFLRCTCCPWRGEEADWVENDSRCPGCGRGEICDTMLSTRRRVFCASLADVFDNEVNPAWRADLFALIKNTPNLDWLLLTKRIGNAEKMIREAERATDIGYSPDFAAWPWPNVWLGATVVNQAEADRDIPKLLATPARVRFLSIEPMLGPIDLRHMRYASGAVLPEPFRVNDERCSVNALEGTSTWPNQHYVSPLVKQRTHIVDGEVAQTAGEYRRIDWIIAGGESGAHARPAHPDWFRSLRDQCAAAGVPFLFKQWGEWAPAIGDMWFYPVDGGPQFLPRAGGKDTHDFGEGRSAVRIGKKAACRLLDGVEHNAFPELR